MPVTELSDDAGGPEVAESEVAAGRLDEPLPDTLLGSMEVEDWLGTNEELKRAISDADFVAWGRAAKKNRFNPYV